MYLIFGEKDDQVVNSFVEFLNTRNANYVIFSGDTDFHFWLSKIRGSMINGRILSVEHNFDIDISEVDGVFNRFNISSSKYSAEEFEKNEYFSSLWALLACTPSKVLNRPSSIGFYSNYEPFDFSRKLSQGIVSRTYISANPPSFTHESIHVKSIASGEVNATPNASGELHQVTHYNEKCVVYILIIGSEFVNLTCDNEFISRDNLSHIDEIVNFIGKDQFSLLVVDVSVPKKTAVLQYSQYPQLYQYKHLNAIVNKKILDFLNGQ